MATSSLPAAGVESHGRRIASRVGLPKFKLSPAEQEELLADYLPWCETVTIPEPPPATPSCRDPSDQQFLHLAVAGTADFLVTGDADLLTLAGKVGCPITTAAGFLGKLEKQG